jgi:hypothetical protein
MPVPTIETLQEEIYALPEQLRQALSQKVEAELEAARLEAAIKKLESQLKKEEEQKEDQDDDESGNAGLIELEDKLKRLRNELTETESKVELEYRDKIAKVTESQVKAAVRNDEGVKKLKREISEQEIKIRTHKSTQRGRQRVYVPRRPYGRSDIESPELDSLREELSIAESNSTRADIEVRTLQAKLEAFKILVQLITH